MQQRGPVDNCRARWWPSVPVSPAMKVCQQDAHHLRRSGSPITARSPG